MLLAKRCQLTFALAGRAGNVKGKIGRAQNGPINAG
jgi:hypothetical protein